MNPGLWHTMSSPVNIKSCHPQFDPNNLAWGGRGTSAGHTKSLICVRVSVTPLNDANIIFYDQQSASCKTTWRKSRGSNKVTTFQLDAIWYKSNYIHCLPEASCLVLRLDVITCHHHQPGQDLPLA